MNPAQKALWFIESHLAEALTLDEIAGVAGISRFHMVRAFAAATGLPVMRYVRARRLTAAARALAGGAPDILNVALDADYGSHEAFTRAFRDHFGVTPEAVRAGACLDQLRLQEPIMMDSTALDHLDPPRFVTAQPLLVAGLGERITHENSGAGIPNQMAAVSSGGRRLSRPDRPGRLWRLLQRRRCRQFRLHRRRRSDRLLRPAARIQPGADSRTEIRCLHPQRSCLGHSPHRQHDLESLAAGVRIESRRRAEFRAL
jgi:AraC-like DNA-binding protein